MNAAKAHYDNAEVQLSYAQIRSPISGIVSDRSVYPGEMPASGTPIDLDRRYFAGRRARECSGEGSVDGSGGAAGDASRGPDGDLAGKVTVVSPAVDPNTTTVEVWVQAR